jgi:uncharacterized membrane protein YbhN (UPF0104 family)
VALDFRRGTFLMAIAATSLVLVAAAALGDVAGWESVVRRLGDFVPSFLPICLAGQIVAYLGYILAVRDVSRVDDGPELPLWVMTKSVVAGFGVFAATHSAGGFIVDFWTLRRAGVSRREAIARVLALGALEYAVLAPAALICAIVLIFGIGASGRLQDAMTYPWLLVVPGFLLAGWLTSPKRVERFADPGGGGRVRRLFAHAVAGIWKLRMLAARPRRHALGLVGVTLYWSGDILSFWAALQVFQPRISLPALILAYATGYILTRRSLPAGGAGVVEVMMTFALVWVGMGFAGALLGVVVYRIFNFWLPILPALWALPTAGRLRREFRRGGERLDEQGVPTESA